MSHFKAKMHQIRFRLWLCPRPSWGVYSTPPDPLAGFQGPTSKRRGEGRKGAKGRGGKGRENSPLYVPQPWRDLVIKLLCVCVLSVGGRSPTTEHVLAAAYRSLRSWTWLARRASLHESSALSSITLCHAAPRYVGSGYRGDLHQQQVWNYWVSK